jgi:hypothetical protein
MLISTYCTPLGDKMQQHPVVPQEEWVAARKALLLIRRLPEKTWTASRKEPRIARTMVLKLKTSEFKILTRSHTPSSPPSSCEELTSFDLSLRDRVNVGPKQRFRLVGVDSATFVIPMGHLRSRPFSSSRIALPEF